MAVDKNRQRHAARRAEAAIRAALEREQGDYRPAPREECDPSPVRYMPVDDSATLRIVTRIWRQSGRMTEFTFTVEAGDWGDADSWESLARIDCKGGTCHEHPVGRLDDHVTLHRLDNIDDVQAVYPRAVSRINEIARMIRDRRPR